MKNRLLAYGFGSDEPEKVTVPPTHPKEPRARRGKGKRLICRIYQILGEGESEYENCKTCIYVDGDGNYFVKGSPATAAEALRAYLVWEVSCGTGRVDREIVDRSEMCRLMDLVVPPRKPASHGDDNEGEEWKAAGGAQ
jgi:hypothetical protein